MMRSMCLLTGGRLCVYGSEEGADLASQCLEHLRDWAWNPHDGGLAENVLEYWNQYVEQVRRDLGVPHGHAEKSEA